MNAQELPRTPVQVDRYLMGLQRRLKPQYIQWRKGLGRIPYDMSRLRLLILEADALREFRGADQGYEAASFARLARLLFGHGKAVREHLVWMVRRCDMFEQRLDAASGDLLWFRSRYVGARGSVAWSATTEDRTESLQRLIVFED